MGATLMRRSICFIQRILFAIAGPVKYGADSASGTIFHVSVDLAFLHDTPSHNSRNP